MIDETEHEGAALHNCLSNLLRDSNKVGLTLRRYYSFDDLEWTRICP
jgi:hypothetical protein